MERGCKKGKKRQKNVSTVCSVEVLIASYVCLAERNLPPSIGTAPRFAGSEAGRGAVSGSVSRILSALAGCAAIFLAA